MVSSLCKVNGLKFAAPVGVAMLKKASPGIIGILEVAHRSGDVLLDAANCHKQEATQKEKEESSEPRPFHL
jgi:hypothetical protein